MLAKIRDKSIYQHKNEATKRRFMREQKSEPSRFWKLFGDFRLVSVSFSNNVMIYSF